MHGFNANEIYICEAVCEAVRKKNHGNKVVGPSRDSPLTFKQNLFDFSTKSEVTRPSADCQTNCFPRYQAIGRIFEKSRWTVTRQWSEVTRLSIDCQTTFFRRFKQLEIFLKKVAERSRDSGRRSRDRRTTVKQRFLDVPIDLGKFWKKLLNGHATVVGVHVTIGRLSNNVF